MSSLVSGVCKSAVIAALCILLQTVASATTYYIDYVSGLDSNNGTSKTTAWQHMPGMQGCSSTCSSTRPAAGDKFILKGGVTWPNSSFPITWSWSGSSTSDIYIGIDQTWSATSSWARPVFDAGTTAMASSYNMFIRIWNQQHVTIDNIEMRNLYWAGTPGYGTVAYIGATGSDYLTLDHLYLHSWHHATGAGDLNGGFIHGDTNQPVHQHSVLQNCVISGADSDNDLGAAVWAWGSLKNCVIHDVINAYVSQDGGVKEIGGNEIYNILNSSSPTHKNAIETVGNSSSPASTWYIHDNVIHDMQIGESMMIGNPNETVYAWNNVIYNLLGSGANPPHFPQSAGTAGLAAYFWNNTVVPLSGNACFIQNGGTPVTTLAIQNNHCISNSPVTAGVTTTNAVIDHNVLQTPTTAGGQGYSSTQTDAYEPTSSNNATVGAGTDLSNKCAGSLSGMCSDTKYACSVDATNQVSCPARTSVARQSTSWDAGAYEFASPTGGGPAPPSGLTAIVQ